MQVEEHKAAECKAGRVSKEEDEVRNIILVNKRGGVDHAGGQLQEYLSSSRGVAHAVHQDNRE